MSDDVFQVVAECAHVTVSGPTGRAQTLLLKGALVPADAPELGRLLREGYVAKVGGDATGGLDATGTPSGAYTTEVPASITTTPVEQTDEQKAAAVKAKAAAELEQTRAAARAKLPEDGAAPDGRAAREVRIEWLAKQGHNYDELAKQDDAALKDLVRQRSTKS